MGVPKFFSVYFWNYDEIEIAYFAVRWKTRASFVYRTKYGHMGFVANFMRKNFENRLKVDKVTESLKVGTFLRHSVDW